MEEIKEIIMAFPSRATIISDSDKHYIQEAEYQPRENGYVMKLKMVGADTAWSYEAEEGETLNITYALQAQKGRAKVILIGPHGEIQELIEATSKGEKAPKIVTEIPLKKGENRIKLLVGKDSRIFFGIQVDKGEVTPIGGMGEY